MHSATLLSRDGTKTFPERKIQSSPAGTGDFSSVYPPLKRQAIFIRPVDAELVCRAFSWCPIPKTFFHLAKDGFLVQGCT
jgi:hypothetical protein